MKIIEFLRRRIKPAHVLIMIMAAAFLLRAISALHRPMIANDETIYVRMAENLADGNRPFDMMGLTTTTWTPLLPVLTLFLVTFFGDYISSAYLLVVTFGALLLLPVYLLAKQMFSERTGLLAAALMALSPLLIDYSSSIYSEGIYSFFLMMGLVFAWRFMQKPRLLPAALTGIFMGLAYLANATATYYIFILIVMGLAVARKNNSWNGFVRGLAIMVAFFCILAAPYVLFLHQELGKWTFTGKDLYSNRRILDLGWDTPDGLMLNGMQLTDDGREIRILDLNKSSQNSSVVRYIAGHPGQSTRQFRQNYETFILDILPVVFFVGWLPLLGLGIFGQSSDRRRGAGIGYILIMSLPALLVLLLWQQGPRYYVPFVPLWLIIAAEGWRYLEDWGRDYVDGSDALARKSQWSRIVPWIAGSLVVLPVLPFVNTIIKHQTNLTVYRQAGEWIRQEAGPGSKIMSTDLSAAYYAGGQSILIPKADYELTAKYARNKGDDYLVITGQDIAKWRPELDRLLHDAVDHPEWILVDTEKNSSGNVAYVFRFTGKE
ncbi:MAG: glycosyltransferase family 39 protein [Thermoleophilia bacterium]|nr:glycosyltransferase family 39 protein [Thermoleophilia bacterium]